MVGLPHQVVRRPFDTDGLAELVGDARVVALGENNHYIAEFGALRAQLVRFLVLELGFTVLAMESGFAEGLAVDAWLSDDQERGNVQRADDLDDLAATGFTFRFGDPPETRQMLRWLHQHNTDGGAVRFAGLDLPGSGGSPAPALEQVKRYLDQHHPGAVELVNAALAATEPYSAANNGLAPARYAQLDTAHRDAATTALTRLVLGLDALPTHHASREHRTARHNALGALRLDEHLRELEVITAARPPDHVISSRDVYQAGTVHLLRELYGGETRIVILQHNAHLQRRPMQLLPMVTAPSAGTYLADALGSDYLAVGITAVRGATASAHPDATARHGISITDQPLDEPYPGSLEHALRDLSRPELLDLRQAPSDGEATTIRYVTTYAAIDLPAAFDAVICLPAMKPARLEPHEGG